MDWKELGTGLVNIAPTVGSFFGPVGAGVGTAISALAKAFGLKPDAKPNEILEAVKADPQALLKLEMAKMDYELEIERENTERLKIQLADVQNARQREVGIVRVTGKRDVLQFGLAVLGVLCPLALVILLLVMGLPKMDSAQAALVGGFVGIIIGEYKTVFQYFFGSSQGSAMKSQAMQKSGTGV